MPGPAVLTLVGMGLLVALIAIYLIRVALILRHVVAKLEAVLNGVVEVSNQSAPIGDVANAINADLEESRKTLEQLAGRARAAAERAAEGASSTPPEGFFGRLRGM